MTHPSADAARITVAICTRNRSALLSAAIASVLDQLEPAGAELLVVDNGSTDDTADVVRSVVDRRPDAHYLLEATAGLSRARNAALMWSRAPVVAFLDDDAVAHPGWVASAYAAFADPEVDAAGGPVALVFSAETPAWLAVPSHATSMLGALDLGPSTRNLHPPQGPYGCNMAVRTSAALRLGGFDIRLGHNARRLGAAEETELFMRLHRAGGKIRWVPSMGIDHLVPPDRARLGYLLRRAFAVGRGQASADLSQRPLSAGGRLRRAASSAKAAASLLLGALAGSVLPTGSWRLSFCESTIHLGRAVQLLLPANAGAAGQVTQAG